MENIYDDLNKQIQIEGKKWVAGETSVSGLSDEEKKVMLGYIPYEGDPILQDPEPVPEKEQDGYDQALPKKHDWSHWKNIVTPVRDQGNHGACVSFAVAATLDSRLRVFQKIVNWSISGHMSPGHLYFTAEPGNFRAAYAFVKSHGITTEKYCPFPRQKPNEGWEKHLTKIGHYLQIEADKSLMMKAELRWNGPLSVAMRVYDDFFHYKEGIYRKTDNAIFKGYHAVCCVGYNDEEQAWICKNSWGTGWGMDGFFKIGYGDCRIEADPCIPLDFTSAAYYMA